MDELIHLVYRLRWPRPRRGGELRIARGGGERFGTACGGSGKEKYSQLPRRAGTKPPPVLRQHFDRATSGSGSTTEPRTSATTTRSAAAWHEARICGRGSGSDQGRRLVRRADRERSATWRASLWATQFASSSSAP